MRLTIKKAGKREFIQQTSKYLKWVAEHKKLIITHQNKPNILLTKIETKSFSDMRGLGDIKIHGDVNETVLPGYDKIVVNAKNS